MLTIADGGCSLVRSSCLADLTAVEPNLDFLHVERVKPQVYVLADEVGAHIEQQAIELCAASLFYLTSFFPQEGFP